MWPFSCKECPKLKELAESRKSHANSIFKDFIYYKNLSQLKWHPLSELPPINTNLLVANKDFSYFGFLYLEDGWDYSRKINMQGKDKVWPTYTNADSIAWWLNLDLIKREGFND